MLLKQIIVEKINPNVKFEYEQDIEGDHNRGWQVDKIEAFLDGQNVGYLKISYIPRERFNQNYKSILQYLTRMHGKNVLPHDHRDKVLDDIPIAALRENIVYAAMSLYRYIDPDEQRRLAALPDNQVLAEYKKFEKYAQKEYGNVFKQFERYVVDKPMVDYIGVNQDSRRKGIGTSLYRAGYEWMKSRGLRFYASTGQSNLAKLAWTQLEQDYPVKSERVKHHNRIVTRRYFA